MGLPQEAVLLVCFPRTSKLLPSSWDLAQKIYYFYTIYLNHFPIWTIFNVKMIIIDISELNIVVFLKYFYTHSYENKSIVLLHHSLCNRFLILKILPLCNCILNILEDFLIYLYFTIAFIFFEEAKVLMGLGVKIQIR